MKIRLSYIIFVSVVLLSCSNQNIQSQLLQQRSTSYKPINKLIDSLYGFEMVYIPAGDLEWEAHPTHHAMTVHLDGFYMGKYEVTQKLWKQVMGEYPIKVNWDALPVELKVEGVVSNQAKELAEKQVLLGDDLPVERVSWDDALEFLKKLSKKTGKNYRLPTEAEWVYAYKAGTKTKYYFGNDTLMLANYEWYNENSGGKPHPVGSKKPNPWGLYDIGGNVAEWTFTIADMAEFEKAYPGRKFSPGVHRVYRGSHYLHTKFAAAGNWQHTYLQALPRGPVGFRIVRDK